MSGAPQGGGAAQGTQGAGTPAQGSSPKLSNQTVSEVEQLLQNYRQNGAGMPSQVPGANMAAPGGNAPGMAMGGMVGYANGGMTMPQTGGVMPMAPQQSMNSGSYNTAMQGARPQTGGVMPMAPQQSMNSGSYNTAMQGAMPQTGGVMPMAPQQSMNSGSYNTAMQGAMQGMNGSLPTAPPGTGGVMPMAPQGMPPQQQQQQPAQMSPEMTAQLQAALQRQMASQQTQVNSAPQQGMDMSSYNTAMQGAMPQTGGEMPMAPQQDYRGYYERMMQGGQGQEQDYRGYYGRMMQEGQGQGQQGLAMDSRFQQNPTMLPRMAMAERSRMDRPEIQGNPNAMPVQRSMRGDR